MAKADIQIHPNLLPNPSALGAVRIRQDVLYTNEKGEEKSGVRKRADKVLGKLQEALGQILEPDETVLYAARCLAPVSPFEQLSFGWYIYYIAATALVFTNKRILHFAVKGNGEWKRSLRAVGWGDIAEARVKGWWSHTLELKYRNGKKERYWGLRRPDGKKIRVLAEKLIPESSGETTAAQGMVPLCPDCRTALAADVYQCQQCRLMFKDAGTMTRRSIVIPGGGYFYCGQWFLGILDAFAEAFLLLVLLLLLLEVVGATKPDAGQEPATWGAVVFVFILLAIEKLFTIYHCKRFVREFIPVKN